jgi:hypothetical protein
MKMEGGGRRVNAEMIYEPIKIYTKFLAKFLNYFFILVFFCFNFYIW